MDALFLCMHLLICAATELEIGPTLDFLKHNELKAVDVLITGVGLPSTMYRLTRKIFVKKPDLIIQAGVAGSLNFNLAPGRVVAIANEVIGDLGVEENGRFVSVFDLNLTDRNVFPWKNGKLCNHPELLNQTELEMADGVSVNEISTNKARIDYYRDQLGVAVESMEGAALHYIGLMEHIPFLQIRAISNMAGERDKNNWKMKEAIMLLNKELQRLILKDLII